MASQLCLMDGISKEWKIPSLQQLLGIVNYAQLDSDGGFNGGIFENEVLAGESTYWTIDSCDTDTDSSTLEYWTVNMKSGETACHPASAENLVRAIYY